MRAGVSDAKMMLDAEQRCYVARRAAREIRQRRGVSQPKMLPRDMLRRGVAGARAAILRFMPPRRVILLSCHATVGLRDLF